MDKDGGPAFPVQFSTEPHYGMSKRDYFAAAALTGILAGHFAETIPHDDVGGGTDAAFFAYQYADAMLKVGGHTDD